MTTDASRDRLSRPTDAVRAHLADVATRPVAVAIVSLLLALVMAHGGDAGRIVGAAAFLIIAAAAVVEPRIGFCSVFPAFYAIPPAPAGIGPAEFALAALLAATTIGSLRLPGSRSALTTPTVRRTAVAVAVLATSNLIVAMSNGIGVSAWLRGAVPFGFLLFAVPTWLLYRGRKPTALDFVGPALAAFAFAARVVYVYLERQLWQPSPYLFVEEGGIGRWVPLAAEEVGRHAPELVHILAMRVTMLCPAATEALIPLGLIWGFGWAVFAEQKALRRFGWGLSSVCLTAALMTQTRSILLAALLTIGGLTCLALRNGRIFCLRAAVQCASVVVLAATVISYFSMQDVYYNRVLCMIETLRGGYRTSVLEPIDEEPVPSETAEGATDAEPKPVPVVRIPTSQPSSSRSIVLTSNDEAKPSAQPRSEAKTAPTIAEQPNALKKPVATKVAPSPKVETTPYTDVNITARFDEYAIGWKMFCESPLVGKGLGVKHTVRYANTQTPGKAASFVTQQVGYIHNWFFYWLMAGGLIGTTAYAFVLGLPVARFRHLPQDQRWFVVSSVALMAVYGLFFAVFRLLPFNLMLGTLCGMACLSNVGGAAAAGDDELQPPIAGRTSQPEQIRRAA